MTGSRITRATGLWCAAGGALLCLAADWPQFLGPTRNGVSTETGLATAWPKKGPPVAWDKEVGEGFSGPVVVGDRVILFQRVGDEEVVECLSTADGATKWKKGYPTSYRDNYGKGDGPRATPLVADGRVFTLGADGVLQCLKLDNGDKVWRRSLHDDYQVRQGFFGVATSPLLEGGRLLVNVGGANGAGIVAFNKNNGKEVWKADDHERQLPRRRWRPTSTGVRRPCSSTPRRPGGAQPGRRHDPLQQTLAVADGRFGRTRRRRWWWATRFS